MATLCSIDLHEVSQGSDLPWLNGGGASSYSKCGFWPILRLWHRWSLHAHVYISDNTARNGNFTELSPLSYFTFWG